MRRSHQLLVEGLVDVKSLQAQSFRVGEMVELGEGIRRRSVHVVHVSDLETDPTSTSGRPPSFFLLNSSVTPRYEIRPKPLAGYWVSGGLFRKASRRNDLSKAHCSPQIQFGSPFILSEKRLSPSPLLN
ncbi:hypothetical protein TNCV_4385961 [Trichonephila clavipes]|nr:hypothetical protein TNCV_4385961 [Trichonephila clavipes]